METAAHRQEEFYERLNVKNATPLWEHLARLVAPEPQSACVPALWRYDELRPLLLEAGDLISAKEAERRVLVLENPGLRGESKITTSLYAGIQLVMPGEIAPTHRHTASALRFVLESDGGYTTVEGARRRNTMHPGDFILTPNWTFHDHGNPGSKPTVWLDGLDLHIVNLLGASFSSHAAYQATNAATPVFRYSYDRARETLETLRRNGPPNAADGFKMEYTDPVTRASPMPTIAAFLQLLPKAFRGQTSRSTDASVYCVVEGSGRSRIGGETFAWKRHDIFIVPTWVPVSHESDEESVMFSFSERAAQKELGVWLQEVQRG